MRGGGFFFGFSFVGDQFFLALLFKKGYVSWYSLTIWFETTRRAARRHEPFVGMTQIYEEREGTYG